MKIIKWIAIVFLGLMISGVIALESFYYYSINQLDLKVTPTEFQADRRFHDVLWVENGGVGDISLDKLSATEFVFDGLYYAFFNQSKIAVQNPQISKGHFSSSWLARRIIFEKIENKELEKIDRISRSLSQVFTSIWISRNYDISTVLNMILAKIYLGKEVFGIEKASLFYFNKNYTDLELNEIVSLIGLAKGPSMYNPHRNPQRFEKRGRYLMSKLKQNWPEKYKSEEFTVPVVIQR